MGLKAPHDTVIPLCRRCHDEFHRLGKRTWEKKYRPQRELVAETQAKAEL